MRINANLRIYANAANDIRSIRVLIRGIRIMLIGGFQKFSLLDYPDRISAIIFTQGCNFRCQFCYNPMLVWSSFAPLSGATACLFGLPAGRQGRQADRPAQIENTAGESAPNFVGEGRDSKLKYAQNFVRDSEQELEPQKVHPFINSADAQALADKQDELFVFLKDRAGKLDAVVITGGEPCLQKDLIQFVKKIKSLGYLIKLDTNGSYPEVLAKLTSPRPYPATGEGAGLIDYIAMDLKAPENKYDEVAGLAVDFNNIRKSVKIIMASGLPYEFRTTVVPDLLDRDDISEMGKIIKGADKWYLQNFKSRNELVNPDLKGRVPYNGRQMNEMAEIGRQYVKKCEVR